MKRLDLFGCVWMLATLPTSAQTLKDKLLGEAVLYATELKALGAFDTLGSWYDQSEASVDTTVVINDSLWMSILWISDADSMPDDQVGWLHSGGVCEYVFLMAMDPRAGRCKSLKEIRTECDVDQSNHDAMYYSHYVRTSTTVEVVSSRARYVEGSDEWEELVPYQSRIYKVLPTGMIALAASGIFTEPRLLKP